MMEPESEEQIFLVLMAIKERKTIILNLARLSPKAAQRAVDCLAGCSCATDGHAFWVDEQTYLFVPNGVKIKVEGNSSRSSKRSLIELHSDNYKKIG